MREKKIKKEEASGNNAPVVDVFSFSGKKVGRFRLHPEIFNARINKPLMSEIVIMYLANKRQGNASTKTRGEVSGGGKKPWRQKGTGRARAGSIRSPLWRHGGVIFGPKPRDYSYNLPKKARRSALLSSLSCKAKDNEIILLEKDPELTEPKTKDIVNILKALKTYRDRVLFLYSKRNENFIRSCRNIENLTLRFFSDTNAYDVLSHTWLMFSKDTHEAIVKMFKETKD